MIGAPGRRLPGLSIPDLEHRRAAAAFFLALIERSLTRPEEGLYRWLGEQQAQDTAPGASVRPDGYGRYLLPEGEITFYLELDRGTEPAGRVKSKLDAYRQALAADPRREHGNILLVCQGPRRLGEPRALRAARPAVGVGHRRRASATRCYPAASQQRAFCELPAGPRQPGRRAADCLGRRWRRPDLDPGAGALVSAQRAHGRPAATAARPKTRARRRPPGGEPTRAERARPQHAATRPSAPSGAVAAAGGEDHRPLRLLEGCTRPMSSGEHRQLVAALAELLADWLTTHPERRPSGLRSTPECDLVDRDEPRAQE